MALDFGFIETEDNRLNVVGPQFEQDATTTKFVHHESTGSGFESAYTVTAGKTFFVTKIMFINGNASTQTFELKLDGNTIFEEELAGDTTREVDFGVPLMATSGQEFLVVMDTSGNNLVMIGIEQ